MLPVSPPPTRLGMLGESGSIPSRGSQPTMIRRLRNLISVMCVLAGVLLVVLWVQSYKTADRLHGRFWGRQSFVIASKQGRVTIIVFRSHAPDWWRWETQSYPVDDELSFPLGNPRQYEKAVGFGWIDHPIYMVMRSVQTMPDGRENLVLGAATATLQGAGPVVPYWFLVSSMAAFAAAARMRWPPRISMLGLLFAVTFIAVILTLVSLLDAEPDRIGPHPEIQSVRKLQHVLPVDADLRKREVN